jgi:hypothetical protein
MSELDKEFRTRNVAFELTIKVTKKCDLLKKDEARRKEEQVDADLLDSPRISIPRLEARSETPAHQTRHNGERRNHKW